MTSYEIDGKRVIPYWSSNGNGNHRMVSPDLFIPELRRVEEIETDESFDSIELRKLELLQAQGFEVWLLVPIARLGAAHETLRGKAHHVQPWWTQDGRIYFGRPEIV